MDMNEAVTTVRQELQALKLIVSALIVQSMSQSASPEQAKQGTDAIKKMALAGVDNSTFNDPATEAEWKAKMKAEITKICDSIRYTPQA